MSKAEFQHLTDEQLLEEIKRQWYDKGAWDHEKLQQYGSRPMSVADDYFSSDVEEHIADLEKEYQRRGLELPDRWQYVAQFQPDEEDSKLQVGIDICPYCGSTDLEDVMDYQAPPDYPYDLIKCNTCFNRWEIEPSQAGPGEAAP